MDIRVLVLPELSSVLLAWTALALIYFILKRFLYKPINNALEARKNKIQDDIQSAASVREEAFKLKKDYEGRIKNSKEEGQEIIDGARLRGEELTQYLLAEAKVEADIVLARAKKEIERQKELAYVEMKVQSGEMAVLIASKIMEEKITYESQKDLINKFIDEVGNAQWQN
jgi:F-type H+-transporting ATPase subunit b